MDVEARNSRLQTIYEDAGRPGAQAFRFAVRRKIPGLQISETEAKAFVAGQSTGQIFQARLPSDGKIVGGGREDMRFQIDLIDYSSRIRKLSGKHRFVLVAVDNYNRQVFTQPVQNKSSSTVLAAFKRIISANAGIMPKEITADNGNEWAELGPYIEEHGGVLRKKNMESPNTLSVIDRVVGKLKTILSGYSLTDWAGALKRATAAYNEASHSYLMGSAPNDVSKGGQCRITIRIRQAQWRADQTQ